MKTVFLLCALCLLLISGCNTEESHPSNGIPVEYNLYLSIKDQSGNSFREGEVEVKSAYINEDGVFIIPNEEWAVLPTDQELSSSLGHPVFGPYFLGMNTDVSEEDSEPGTVWVSNQLLILRYQGISEIDTLRSRDSARFPDYRYFDIFKNDTLLERFNDPENYIEKPWKITIQKSLD